MIQLPFLDVRISRNHTRYFTSVYRKKTFTGVYIHWTSLTSRRYKIGIINYLLNRAWNYSTNLEDRDMEVEKIRSILMKNGYPEHVIETNIDKFIKRKNTPDPPIDTEHQPEPEIELQKTRCFITLPYVHRKADEFAYRLKSTVNKCYPDLNFNVAFKSPKTIGSMFPFKDNMKNQNEKALVVYSVKCKKSQREYIGKTKHRLCTKMNQHKSNISSSCHLHELEHPGHMIDYDNVQVIDSASNDFKLQMKELLHILKRDPDLNKQYNSQSSFDIRTLIINAHPQHRQT